ncbi:MAG: hypothetical protein ACRC46_14880 [Thermoguttaceae bacterium]
MDNAKVNDSFLNRQFANESLNVKMGGGGVRQLNLFLSWTSSATPFAPFFLDALGVVLHSLNCWW